MPQYLQKRRRRYYAVMEIPRKLRQQFGKARFVRSLETDSEAVAKGLLHAVLAEWQAQLDGNGGLPTIDYVTRRGSFSKPITPPELLFHRLRQAATPEERAAILAEIDEAAGHIGSVNVEIGRLPSSDAEARRYAATATGSAVAFTAHLDEWQATMNVTKKTKDMQRADVIRFAAKFASVQEVTRPEVRRWISSLMAADTPLTPKTVQRILSALRGYWRYLQSVSVAGETDEPFDKLDVARQGGRATEDKRKPFKSADVVQMLNAAITKEDEELADVIRLAMWSGARIEELASLKVQNVAADHFTVADAKTTAGVREVPIHAALAQTMTRLIDGRTTGHVLATLKPNKYGDRSNAVGKRFGRLARKQGFGPAYVFHSIRKTVATQLENAGVAEGIAADILGHEKPTMTYGLYSGGATLALKAEAIAKLAY